MASARSADSRQRKSTIKKAVVFAIFEAFFKPLKSQRPQLAIKKVSKNLRKTMVFSSLAFIFAFLPVVWAVFHLLKNAKFSGHYTAAKVFLIVASLFFYAYFKLEYLPILLGTIIVNFTLARLILRDLSRNSNENPSQNLNPNLSGEFSPNSNQEFNPNFSKDSRRATSLSLSLSLSLVAARR